MDLFEKCVFFNKFKKEEQLINSYKSEELEDFGEDNLNGSNLIETESYEFKNNWQWLSLRHERRLNEILNLIKSKNNNKNNVIDHNNLINVSTESLNRIDPKVFSSFLPNVLSNYIYSLLIDNYNHCNNNVVDVDNNDYNSNIVSNKDNINDEKDDVNGIENRVKVTLLNNNNILSTLSNNPLIFNKHNNQELRDLNDFIIMFCDISGFTHITELIERNNNSTHVARLGQFLRDFFYPLVDLVHHFGGDIVQFSGDALLCLFYLSSTSNNFNNVNNNEDKDVHEPNITNTNSNSTISTTKDNYQHNYEDNEDNVRTFVNCLKCCEELHRTLSNYPLLITEDSEDENELDKELDAGERKKEENKLELHISCVFGKAAMRVVGGLFDRFECYVDGSALRDLSELAVVARPTCTVVCDAFRKVVGKFANFEVVSNSSDGRLYYQFVSFNEGLVEELRSANEQIQVASRSDKGTDNGQIDSKLYIKMLSYFIPRYIYNKLLNNVYLYSNEIRNITVIFINFQINHNNSNEDNVLKSNMIKELMYICQKSIYAFEGTLNKLIVDDKGLSVLVFMGFPPFFTENASFNAILCGLNISHNVNKLYNSSNNRSSSCYSLNNSNSNNNNNTNKRLEDNLINVGVGISTGNVWCGILGNRDRREYTSIGDVVNLSNRLMSYSLKLTHCNHSDFGDTNHSYIVEDDIKNVTTKNVGKEDKDDYSDNLKIIRENQIRHKIIVDSMTFEDCRNLIELVPLRPIKIKNKPNKYNIYTTTGQLLNHPYSSSSSFSGSTLVESKSGTSVNKDNYTERNGKWNMGLLRMMYGDGVKVEEIVGSKVVHFKCNDENDNELLYNFLMSEIEENCPNWKSLNIDYTKTVLGDFEGVHREVYSELVHKVINLWFNSSNRLNFYYSPNLHMTTGDNYKEKQEYINKYLNIGNKNDQLILKELLEPKYHWYLNILLDEPDAGSLYDIIQFNCRSKRSSNVLNELFLPTTSEGSRTDCSEECEAVMPDKSKVVGDILMLFERERRRLDDYVFSLIQALNRYDDLVLLINLKDECPPLVRKLLEYSKNSLNKLVLVIIDNDCRALEELSCSTLRNFSKRVDLVDNREVTYLSLHNLSKPQIKQIIHHILSNNNDQLVINNGDDNINNKENEIEKLVDVVFNNTNGIYYFVYLYVEHITNFFNSNNYQVDKDNQLNDLVKNMNKLFEKKIANYFKYKIDKLELNELFVLKLLTLLNQTITVDRLEDVIKIGDLKSQKQIYNNINVKQILLKFLNFNLITACNSYNYNNGSNQDNCNSKEDNNNNYNDNKEKEFVVNNRILKRLIKDMIIVEEKLEIVNNYVINI